MHGYPVSLGAQTLSVSRQFKSKLAAQDSWTLHSRATAQERVQPQQRSLTAQASASNSNGSNTGPAKSSNGSGGDPVESDQVPEQAGSIEATPVQRRKPKAWRKGWQLVMQTSRLVWSNAWPIFWLSVLCDAALFLLHRISARSVNEVAIRFLLPPHLAKANAFGGSLWWLSINADIANFQTGYQWVVYLFFLLMFPLSMLVRTYAGAASQLVLTENLEAKGNPSLRPPLRRIFKQVKDLVPQISSVISRLWQVNLLVAVRAIPLQGLSLFLIPIPWTLPWLLNLQLALPASLFEGQHGEDAIKASTRLVQPLRTALALPYIGLLVTSKLLAFLGRLFLSSLSPRIARDIPEVPVTAYIIVAAATFILNRVLELLPLVAYVEAKKAQGKSTDLKLAH